jgi:hypothetical protein
MIEGELTLRMSKDNSTSKYAVAISFLSKDDPIAADFHARLSEGLDVFYYPRNQEDLAGTDGQESMRTPFFNESRVAVVLFREPWGKTPWTRVEETAIKEGCLALGWNRLFFVTLDKTSTVPIWVPTTHIRFSFEEFGIEQAVGAIKARVLENGGRVEPLTPLRSAQLYEAEKSYQYARGSLNTDQGLDGVRRNIEELFVDIAKQAAEISVVGSLKIRVGTTQFQCVLTTDRISIILNWHQRYSNVLDGCSLSVREMNQQSILPEHYGKSFMPSEPTVLKETLYVPEISRSLEVGWIQKGHPVPFLSTAGLAQKLLIELIDLANRDSRGKVTRPDFG